MRRAHESSSEPSDAALATFHGYLMRHGGRIEADFATFCADHAPMTAELRALGRRWSGDDLRSESSDPAGNGTADAPGRNGSTPPPATPRWPEIDGFTIEREIGRGGMGVVYEARQLRPRRPVALKVIRADLVDESRRRRFERESQALALLRHRGIVPLFAVGCTADGSPWFAMERIDGVPLDQYVTEHGPSREERLQLFQQIGAAVAHAHQRGVIHRDLKPSNILVASEDGESEVRVLDFGLAQISGAAATIASTHAETGRVLGTLAYMSPEQARGDLDAVDERSDVYSLGVVLYELLADRRPIEVADDWIGRAVDRVVNEPPPPVSIGGRRRELRGDLDTITGRALAKEKDARYPSVAALVTDVDRHLRGRPILARPPSITYRLQRLVSRHRTTAAIAAIATLLLLTATAVGAALLAGKNRELTATNAALLRLADLWRVEQLRDDVTAAWPMPNVNALRDLRDRGRELLARLPLHRQSLGDLVADRSDTDAETSGGELRATMVRLVSGLEKLAEPEFGLLADLDRGLEFARTARERTIEGPDARLRWDEAIEIAADPTICPMYEDLELTPQLGLLPLGLDPESGLLEFWHVESGDEPRRNSYGRLLVTETSGVVLLLLPGGRFWMGAQSTDPDGRNYDPLAKDTLEGPPHEIELAPFFLSKYELTQGQWLALRGRVPSKFLPGNPSFQPVDRRNPVERVNYEDAMSVLHRLSLDLPTEAQWEYAARAGMETPYPHGDSIVGLDRFANIADRHARDHGGPPDIRYSDELDDGLTVHAPVGSLQPNRFGLHDILGNVHEWCKDAHGAYDKPVRPGDGIRMVRNEDGLIRGGSYATDGTMARHSFRSHPHMSLRHDNLGFRPARALIR